MRGLNRIAALAVPALLVAIRPELGRGQGRGCPADMVRVRDYCVDRFEISSVDERSGEALSPYYPPDARLVESIHQAWLIERERVGGQRARALPLPELARVQRTRTDYAPRAVAKPGVVPQAYLSQALAQKACERAGKRLCTEGEWMTACRGERGEKFPYGAEFEAGRCNVYRHVHPAAALHGASFYGHRDPRLNLLVGPGAGPLLRLTGTSARCASRWGGDRIFDMVGNLDEWVDDPNGLFLGGFYARSTREGCEARVSAHPPSYYDYTTGARCCRAAER